MMIQHSMVEQKVIGLKRVHSQTWRDCGQLKWTVGLLEEVWELLLALVGLHRHSPDWELRQIAAIAMNWLEMREEREGERDDDQN